MSRNELGSLRGLLLRSLILPLLLLSVGAGVGAYAFLRDSSEIAYDQALGDAALALIPHLRNEEGAIRLALSPEVDKVLRTDRHDQVYYQVRNTDGTVIGGDRDLPPPPMAAPSRRDTYAFATRLRDIPLRAIALSHTLGDTPITLVVAETTRKRERMAWQLRLGLLVPLFLVAAGAVVISMLAVRRGLRPLRILQEDIAHRPSHDLRPLPAGHAVEEVVPLLNEINALLERLARANAAQRRFVANAAHQLRTPLTGLRTQLELALTEEEGPQREHRIATCRDAADRMARLINQILALAASEEGGREAAAMQPNDLAIVLGELAEGWVRTAIAREIDLGFQLEPARLNCDGLLIQELAGNLVDNALRYAGKGASVTVRSGLNQGRAFLSVEDNGPGLSAQAMAHLGQRYFRPDGSPGVGSGLGLAIVGEIAARHGATLTVAPGQDGGLRIRVDFPEAATITN